MIAAGLTLATVAISVLAGSAELALRSTNKAVDYDCRNADGYRTDRSDWQSAHFDEWREAQLSFQWEPFSYWRSMPREGAFINVDAYGIRRTPQNPSVGRPRALLFGGSTMWGAGVRDEGTIPAHLVALSAERFGCNLDVTNCGQIGYVATQNLIALMRRLQSGDVPDVVVFYDGYNDVLSAMMNGRAGLAFHEAHRGVEFNILHRTRDLASAAIRSLRLHAVLTKKGKLRPRDAGDTMGLAVDIADRYLATAAIIRSLAKSFGFTMRCYWQPTIFRKLSLTSYEQGQKEKISESERLFEFVEGRIAARIAQDALDDVVLLNNIFHDETRPVFIDWAHLTESANRQVAEAILIDLARSPIFHPTERVAPPARRARSYGTFEPEGATA